MRKNLANDGKNFGSPPFGISNPAFWSLTLLVAVAEGLLGAWLRNIPTQTRVAPAELATWLAALLAILLVRVAASWGRDREIEITSIREGKRFVRRIWSGREFGSLQGTWLTREGREVAEQGAKAIRILQSSAASLVVLIPLLVWLSPLLSGALLLLVPAVGWVSRRRWQAAKTWASREQHALSEHSTEEDWAWRAVPESRSSGFLPLLGRVRRTAASLLAEGRARRVRNLVDGQAQTELAAHLAGWTLATLALFAWSRGLLAARDLLAFLAAALLVYRPIREAGRALPAFHRFRDLGVSRSETRASKVALPPGASLRVRDLRVVADDGTVLVDGPSFELEPGGALLLSGANGSGKSSLLGGLAGWHRAWGIESLPKCMRLLAQEPVLPPFSPRQWSGMASPVDLPLYPILFPSGLPCAWDESIPAGGARLSRGERARLALLCQTARSADLWLFDEPFSALPFGDRSALLAALRSVQGRAALVFTDPSTLEPSTAAQPVWSPEDSHGRPTKGPTILRLW